MAVWKLNYLQPLEGGSQPGKQAHVQVPWGAMEPPCLASRAHMGLCREVRGSREGLPAC